MTALLVERAGRRVAMAGNIGPTLLGTLSDALDKEPMPQPKVEEGAEPEEAIVAMAVESVTTSETSVDLPDADVLLEPVDEVVTAEAPVAEAAAETPAEPAPAEPAPADDRSALDTVAELLDEQPLPIKPPPPKPAEFEVLPQVWVLELSSFQLDGVKGFEPSAGAVLNITQDHLDWHGDMASYARAKGRIFGEHGVLVINRDDPEVEALVPAPITVKQGRAARPRSSSATPCASAWTRRAVPRLRPAGRERHGLAAPDARRRAARARPSQRRQRAGRAGAGHVHRLARWRHAARPARVPRRAASRRVRQHIKGVDFYDDSKGTNVGATVAAVMGLGADRAPAKLVMILGGDGKGQDFSPLATPIALHARAVALIGRDGPQIEAALQDSGVLMHRHDSLEAATHWSLAQAHAGDSVLLSPACASMDMFRNYAHRAEVFIATVRELAEDEGLIG
ncbi:mur ligase middle domain-containing protein [Ditylenchus destructor]|nr:mur ligase middle domain-containing protein [Ditylenchus destructor]